MIFLRENVSDSMSKVCPVRAAIRSQCLCFMALLAMSSSRGQLSLKSSMVFFKSMKACQSFKARGSLRQLKKENAYTCINFGYALKENTMFKVSLYVRCHFLEMFLFRQHFSFIYTAFCICYVPSKFQIVF